MGTFTLIPPMSLGNLNKAEKLSLLKRYMKLMPSGSDSESPDEISLLADSGVPVLNISAGQVTRMNGIIDELTELTMQASSSEETPEMQQVEADRDTAGNYIVRRVLDYAKLPLAAERTAAQRMEPALRGYRDFANLPTAQETEVINGLLIDLAKPEFADSVVTLQLAPYICRATTAQRSLCRAGRPTRQIEIGTHRECDLQGAVLRGARPAGRYVRTGQCLQPVATLGRGARICS